MNSMNIQKITIIGLGLLGGSLALSLKKKRAPAKIVGTSRRASTVRKALKRRIIDEGILDHKRAVMGSDLIFICTPINKIIPTLKEISPLLKAGAIVTDIGSTKEWIVREADRIIPKKAFFVGGHPMAGTEETGLDAAMPGLFEGKPYIITPTPRTNKRAVSTLEGIIKKLKVRVIKMSPEKQDILAAGISHLPLAVAAALVNTIASMKGKKDFAAVASSGFRDTTRVASGDPKLGTDIFFTNKDAVLMMLSRFKRSLSKIEKDIKKGRPADILRDLSLAKKFRDTVYPK